MNLLTEEHLSYLPKDLIENAKTMSKAYEYIYCIENLIRLHIINKLGNDFAQSEKVARGIALRKDDELKNNWIPLRGQSDIFYTDFKELEGIIDKNWEKLQSDFPDRYWIISKLSDLARFRNMIAHNSSFEKSDFDIVRAYFNVIARQLNLTRYKKSDIPDSSDEGFVRGLIHSKVYSYEEICNGVIHPLVYPLDLNVAPEYIKTEFEQIGVNYTVHFKETRTYLAPNFSTDQFENIEEFYEKREFLKIQIGQYDIDSDGIDEIFICLQVYDPDYEIENEIVLNVFKYYPTAFQAYGYRQENWKVFGPFHTGLICDKPIANVNIGSIFISRNLRNYYDKWTYLDGEFIHNGF